MKKIIMAAKADNNIIGKNNELAWYLPADLKFFKQTTRGHTLIMGRKTFESLSNPLPHRDSWIITRNNKYAHEGITIFHSLKQALHAGEQKGLRSIFILGGGEIYSQSMQIADSMIITEVHHEFEGDTYFPPIDPAVWREVSREKHEADGQNKYDYSFVQYERRP
jgi:dihydrofolate reductase